MKTVYGVGFGNVVFRDLSVETIDDILYDDSDVAYRAMLVYANELVDKNNRTDGVKHWNFKVMDGPVITLLQADKEIGWWYIKPYKIL